MRGQCDLMRLVRALGEELVQHAKCDLSLSPGTLVDGRGDCAGSYLRNEIGKQVGRNNGQAVEQFRVAGRVQYGNRGLSRDVYSAQVRKTFKQVAACAIRFRLCIVIFDGI